jgi:hypothetical protein
MFKTNAKLMPKYGDYQKKSFLYEIEEDAPSKLRLKPLFGVVD